MRILVVGNGAREHAITWKMAQSPSCPALFVAPGNAGTAQIAENIPIDAEDIDSLLQYVTANDIDLTFVGPEVPLAAGIVDRFEGAGCLVFGPTQRAARIESSKSFAKDVMASAGIPTAAAQVFDNTIDALAYIESTEPPYVIKADGLAAGKGVIMASERADATTAIRAMMDDNSFGAAGKTILIEEWLMGQEVSVFAFVDGEYVSPMVAACDYKRVGDGDTGPNTGGMGSYSPPPFWNGDLDEEVRRRYQRIEQLSIERLTVSLELGKQSGFIRQAIDAPAAAFLVHHAVDMAATQLLVRDPAGVDPDRVLSELADMICRYCLEDKA